MDTHGIERDWETPLPRWTETFGEEMARSLQRLSRAEKVELGHKLNGAIAAVDLFEQGMSDLFNELMLDEAMLAEMYEAYDQ